MRTRLRWIDLARGVAVMLMIATHVADAFLAETWRSGALWDLTAIIFGFVAPAFLLLSGVTLYIALDRRSAADSCAEDGRAASGQAADGRVGAVPRKLLVRLGLLVALGYWLQAPSPSLRGLIERLSANDAARLFDANILQVLALGGLLLALTARLAGRLDRARMIALMIAVIVAFATPYVWQGDLATHLPAAFRSYAAPTPPATFGLFPALAYSAFGFFIAPHVIAAAGERSRGLRLAGLGVIMLAAGAAITPLVAGIPPHDTFWGSSAQHVVFRAGGVVLAVAACTFWRGDSARAETWLEYAGRKSLPIYVLNLIIIYGSPMTAGMNTLLAGALHHALSPIECGLVLAALAAFLVVALHAWDSAGRAHPRAARWGIRTFWGTCALLALVLP